VTKPYVPFWYAIALAFIAVVAISLSGVAYTNHVQKQAERRSEAARIESERRAELVRIESDRRWCSLLVDIGNSQRAVPPKTESGIRFAAEIDKLRREFGCPE
jgi:hypothetical protein